MTLVQWKMESDLGPLFLVASADGLRGIFFKKQKVPMIDSLATRGPEVRHLAQASKELQEYFKGKRQKFEVSLDIEGTEFQKKVWKELLRIPFGKTSSYRDVASRLGGRAFRAVGTANGKNPLCVIIPCHRVISANGGLGGYSGGLHLKKKLLILEGHQTF